MNFIKENPSLQKVKEVVQSFPVSRENKSIIIALILSIFLIGLTVALASHVSSLHHDTVYEICQTHEFIKPYDMVENIGGHAHYCPDFR